MAFVGRFRRAAVMITVAGALIAAVAEARAQDDELAEFEDEYADAPALAVADPLAPLNRAVFVFNDKLYLWLIEPVAAGYARVVPRAPRRGLRNFFDNIRAPVRIVNHLLQWKPGQGAQETGRFLANTTLGALGFSTYGEKRFGLESHEEDLGQTFGRYGLGSGCHLVLPLLGPSNLRDLVGRVGDAFLDPLTYVAPHDSWVRPTIQVGEAVNTTSLRLGEYEDLKKGALDPYILFRDAYEQYRAKKVAE